MRIDFGYRVWVLVYALHYEVGIVFGWRTCKNALRFYGYGPVAVPPARLRESSRKGGTATFRSCTPGTAGRRLNVKSHLVIFSHI